MSSSRIMDVGLFQPVFVSLHDKPIGVLEEIFLQYQFPGKALAWFRVFAVEKSKGIKR